jgi:hypothetical protein
VFTLPGYVHQQLNHPLKFVYVFPVDYKDNQVKFIKSYFRFYYYKMCPNYRATTLINLNESLGK